MSGVRFTVLGSAGTYPSAERLCSSYLLEADGYRLVLDLGHGALHNLQKRCDVCAVDAVLLSHLHVDHFCDIYGLNYARRFARAAPAPLPVIAPPGAREFVGQLLPDESLSQLDRWLAFQAANPGDVLTLGPFQVEYFAAYHPLPTLAPRITCGDVVIAYTGDSAYTERLIACAQDADLFVCDCTWRESERPLPEGVHMTGTEAGKLAAAAHAKRLLVTHVSPYNDPEAVADDARTTFDGEVVVATDLLELAL